LEISKDFITYLGAMKAARVKTSKDILSSSIIRRSKYSIINSLIIAGSRAYLMSRFINCTDFKKSLWSLNYLNFSLKKIWMSLIRFLYKLVNLFELQFSDSGNSIAVLNA
jgi:hypothetical protein